MAPNCTHGERRNCGRGGLRPAAPLFFSGILLVGLATATFSGGNSAAKLAASGMLLVRALGVLQTCQLVLQQRNDAIPSQIA